MISIKIVKSNYNGGLAWRLSRVTTTHVYSNNYYTEEDIVIYLNT